MGSGKGQTKRTNAVSSSKRSSGSVSSILKSITEKKIECDDCHKKFYREDIISHTYTKTKTDAEGFITNQSIDKYMLCKPCLDKRGF